MRKGIGGHHSANSRSDEWITPPEIIAALGEFDLDPCAAINQPWKTAKTQWTIEDDGFFKTWFGRVWLNPPYGKSTPAWLNRMATHGNGIVLVFARTETRMFFDYVWNKADAILFIKSRLNFYRVDGTRSHSTAGAPSVLIAYGKHNTKALRNSNIAGKYISLGG